MKRGACAGAADELCLPIITSPGRARIGDHCRSGRRRALIGNPPGVVSCQGVIPFWLADSGLWIAAHGETGFPYAPARWEGLVGLRLQAFGEQRTELQLTLAEGDYVAILHTHHTRSTGPFLGNPPTGARVVVPGIELFRFSAGKIARFWRFDADVSLLGQLGLLPALQPAA